MSDEYDREEVAEDEEYQDSDDDNDPPKPESPDISSTPLGVSEEELEIYSLVITYGNATVGDLSLLSKHSIDQIEQLIESLKAKKMIIELPGLVPRYQAVPPFEGLAKEVSEVSLHIEKLRQELKKQIREASITVRDALIGMAKDNLGTLSSHKETTEKAKSATLQEVEAKQHTWSSLASDAIDKYDTSSAEVISDWKSTSISEIDNSRATIDELMDQTSTELLGTISSAKDDSADITNTFKSEMISSVSELETRTKEKIASQLTTIDSLLDNETDTFKQKMNNAESSLLASVQSIEGRATESINTASSKVSQAIESRKQETISSINLSISNIIKKYSDMETSIKASIAENTTKEEQVLDRHATSLDASFDKLKETTMAALQRMQSSQNENYRNLDASATSGIEALTSQVDELQHKSKSFLETTTNSMKGASTSAMQGFHDRVSQYSKEVTEDTHSLLNLRKEQLKKTIDELLIQIQNTINSEANAIAKTLDELAVKIDTSHQGMTSTLDSSLQTASANLNAQLSDLTQATDSALDQISDSSKQTLVQMRSEFESAIETSRNANMAMNAEIDQTIAAANNELVDTKTDLMDSLRTHLNEMNQSFSNEISIITANGEKEINDVAVTTKAGLEQSISESTSEFDSEMDEARQSIADTVSQGSQAIKSSMVSIKEEFEISKEQIQSGVSSSFDSVSDELSAHRTESQSRIDALTNSLTSGLVTKLDTKNQEIEDLKNRTSTSIRDRNEEVKNAIASSASDLQSRTKNLLTTNLESSKAELEGLTSKLKQDIARSYQELEGQQDALRETLSSSIAKLEESPMLGLTDETLEQAFAPSSKDQVDTRQIAERLSSVWDRVRATDFPGAKKTWNVVTRNAVNAHIMDMLERAKSKVTLIVPEASDVPTETLMSLKTTTGVELVVTESGLLGKAVKPLIGRGNIRVRSRSEKDVFACVRDSEEVIMAPAATNDADVIGVVSEDDGFVKFVMSIIGPIFQAKTKLLKAEDL